MIVNWDDYKIYHPGTFGPLRELSRVEARKAFDKLMEERPARIEMLRQLLVANGVQLAASDRGIQELNDWFLRNVEADPRLPGRLLPDWYSVVNDVALFLGDVLIGLHPELRWEFYTWGKKNVSYQRHVIMGFSKSTDPKANVDFDRRVAAYGHRIVASRGSLPSYGRVVIRGVEIDVDAVEASSQEVSEIEADAFLQWVKTAGSRA